MESRAQSHHKNHPLTVISEAERAKLQALIEAQGVVTVAKTMGIHAITLTKLAAGLGVLPAIAAHITAQVQHHSAKTGGTTCFRSGSGNGPMERAQFP